MLTYKIGMNLITKILTWFGFGDAPLFGGMARSSQWPQTKREYAKIHPKKCVLCGGSRVQLHHRQPFHAKPELENDLTNLVWLCEGIGTNHHHLWAGHLGNFQSINFKLDEYISAVAHRPFWNGTEWAEKVGTLTN